MRRLSVLGSTGSIGDSTLDLIRRAEPGRFEVVALTAHQNAQKLLDQALEFGPEFVALSSTENADLLIEGLTHTKTKVGVGPDALIEAAQIEADFIMAAIIGSAGLRPTLAAISQGTHVGLANKESLVCAGELVMSAVKHHGCTLLPIDSEHNAIFQVLSEDHRSSATKLILTASGGPFLHTPLNEMKNMGVEDALNHPVWSMGSKITIDSATMMNKGLELIEASFMFERPSSDIDIIIHPQSIIHSMVEYIDGSVLAQMGTPDMRTPIAYALGWPNRMNAPVEKLDLVKHGQMTFFAPNLERFPCLAIARQALEAGGMSPNIMNAANEVAVAAFLNREIGFTQIAEVVEQSLQVLSGRMTANQELEAVLAVDEESRGTATGVIQSLRS